VLFRSLEEIGWHVGLFAEGSTKTRGRKAGVRLDLNKKNNLDRAIAESTNTK
jgi:hypothetical protein